MLKTAVNNLLIHIYKICSEMYKRTIKPSVYVQVYIWKVYYYSVHLTFFMKKSIFVRNLKYIQL